MGTCVRMYVLLYECVYVRTYIHTYVRDPVRLRLRHLYQVEFCSFIVKYHRGHPCTLDTFLVVFFCFGFVDLFVIYQQQSEQANMFGCRI